MLFGKCEGSLYVFLYLLRLMNSMDDRSVPSNGTLKEISGNKLYISLHHHPL